MKTTTPRKIRTKAGFNRELATEINKTRPVMLLIYPRNFGNEYNVQLFDTLKQAEKAERDADLDPPAKSRIFTGPNTVYNIILDNLTNSEDRHEGYPNLYTNVPKFYPIDSYGWDENNREHIAYIEPAELIKNLKDPNGGPYYY